MRCSYNAVVSYAAGRELLFLLPNHRVSVFGIFNIWHDQKKGLNVMSNATIHLLGRVVNDPEVREGKEQRKFVTFRLAVNNQFGATEHAAFYTCTGNEYMANRITKAGLAKGRLISVVGSFNPREYQTKTGETRMSLDVGLYDWTYVGGKPKSEENSNDAAPAAKPAGTVHPESDINDEDDLPI